jgi:hypothetical protein
VKYHEALKLEKNTKTESASFMILINWWQGFKSAMGLKQIQIHQFTSVKSGSGYRNQRREKTGSRIRIRNNAETGPDPGFAIALAKKQCCGTVNIFYGSGSYF